jgi:hypothetical protein
LCVRAIGIVFTELGLAWDDILLLHTSTGIPGEEGKPDVNEE